MAVLVSCCGNDSASPQAGWQNQTEMTIRHSAESQADTTGLSFLSRTAGTARSNVLHGAPGASGRTVGRSVPFSVSGIRRQSRLSDPDIRSLRSDRIEALRQQPSAATVSRKFRGSCATPIRHHTGSAGTACLFKRLRSNRHGPENRIRSHCGSTSVCRTGFRRSRQHWTDFFDASSRHTV